MKMYKFTPVAVVALALMAEPALAQSTANSQKSFKHFDPIARLLHLGPYATVASSQSAAPEAMALGLATAKTYKFASADYPGAGTSIVLDENLTTILGDTTLGSLTSTFTLKGTSYQLLNLAGAQADEATGINTGGQIVGIYADASAVVHGFLDNAGVLTNIDDPSANTGQTTPFDINDGGKIVGPYTDVGGVTHGFYTTDSGVTFSNFDFPGAMRTEAAGVNTAGDIVGDWEDASMKTHAFLLKGGVFTSFDFPLATSTTAIGINDSGAIAGYFVDASSVDHGFIYANNAFTQIDVAGAASTQLTRIKNNGHITGIYTDVNKEEHGLTGR